MKNPKIKDERIVQMHNKLLSEAYLAVVVLLAISLVVKAWVLKAHYTAFLSELCAIALSTMYIVIRSMMTGNALVDISLKGKARCFIAVLGLSSVIAVFNGLKNYAAYGDRYSGIHDVHFLAVLAVSFLSSFVLIAASLFIVCLCHRKGQQKIERALSEDDMADGVEEN